MTVYDIAQIERDGFNLILVPVNPLVGVRQPKQQQEFRLHIERCAELAGLSGLVVPVWRGYTGKIKFIAPDELSEVLFGLEWPMIAKHLNHKLACPEAPAFQPA